tara:strand:- start:30 stop:443 length:414 start_codon:yes stop_codon:yes gene_type:complete
MDSKTKEILQKFSTQKVELATLPKAKSLIRDFTKAEQGMKAKRKVLDSLLQEFKNIEKIKTRADKEYREALDFMNIYLEGKDKYNNVFDEIEKKAKELGIDVRDIPALDILNKSFDGAANAYRPLAETNIDIRDFIR